MPAAIDTLKFSKRLEAAGMAQAEAEAIAEAIAEGMTEGLATKQDIAELRVTMATQQDINELHAAVKIDLAELRTDILRWSVGTIIAMTAVFAAVVKLL